MSNEHIVALNREQTQALREWLERPNGNHVAHERASFDAAGDGGILVRVWAFGTSPGEVHRRNRQTIEHGQERIRRLKLYQRLTKVQRDALLCLISVRYKMTPTGGARPIDTDVAPTINSRTADVLVALELAVLRQAYGCVFLDVTSLGQDVLDVGIASPS